MQSCLALNNTPEYLKSRPALESRYMCIIPFWLPNHFVSNRTSRYSQTDGFCPNHRPFSFTGRVSQVLRR